MNGENESITRKKSNLALIAIITLSILNIVAYNLALWSGYIQHVGLDKIRAFFIFILGYIFALQSGYIHTGGIAALGWLVLFIVFIMLLPFTIINVISILIFLITKRPEGKAKIISYAFLAFSIYLLIRLAII